MSRKKTPREITPFQKITEANVNRRLKNSSRIVRYRILKKIPKLHISYRQQKYKFGKGLDGKKERKLPWNYLKGVPMIIQNNKNIIYN